MCADEKPAAFGGTYMTDRLSRPPGPILELAAALIPERVLEQKQWAA
jgi:hypothetical protein